MNIFEMLKTLQDFRAQLEAWGIGSGVLWAVGFVAMFFFVLSTREVLGWYMRTNHLRDEVKALRAELREMQALLAKLVEHSSAAGPQPPPSGEKGKEPDSPSSKPFKLTHWRNSL